MVEYFHADVRQAAVSSYTSKQRLLSLSLSFSLLLAPCSLLIVHLMFIHFFLLFPENLLKFHTMFDGYETWEASVVRKSHFFFF